MITRRVYRLANRARRIYRLAALTFIGFVCFGTFHFQQLSSPSISDWIILAFSALSLVFSIGMIVYTYRVRLEMGPASLLFREMRDTRELPYRNITGWRIRATIELQTPEGWFRIDRFLAWDQFFYDWLRSFPNLDEQLQRKELTEASPNDEEAITEPAALKKLIRVRLEAQWFDRAAIALAVWTVIWPVPYIPLLLVGAVMPWLAALFMHHRRGWLEFDGDSQSIRPTAIRAVGLPGCVLLTRALLDATFATFGYLHLLLGLPLGLLLAAAVLWADPSARKLLTIIPLLLFTMPYGFGVAALANSIVDDSPASAIQRVQRDKGTYCFVEHAGAFGLPWRKPVPCPSR
ncbi:MAG: hypothetical protein JNK87_34350 [Bryobacterales bacterium]|nr:hypothetical protein [Bryobacterales bacterium]